MPRKRSMIWNYFTQEGHGRARCSNCLRIVSFLGGSTGNLMRHLRQKHPFVLLSHEMQATNGQHFVEDCIEVIASTEDIDVSHVADEISHGPQIIKLACIESQENSVQPISEERSEQLDKQLVRLVVKEYHPLSLVENAEFREFVRKLCPTYNLPNRDTLRNTLIPHYYQYNLTLAKKNLQEAAAVCITIDSWTSIDSESYVTVTAHFINCDCEMRSVLLNCTSYNENHTAEDISVMFKRVVSEWKISHKVVAAVSDNDVNISAAISLCNWKHLQCFAQAINIVVQSGLPAITGTVAKVRSIVECFKRNPEALVKLHSVVQRMELPKLKLKEDAVTSWNSTLDMLRRSLTLKEAIITSFSDLKSNQSLPTQHEWSVIENAVSVLTIFEELTVEINSEKTLLASKVILFVNALRRRMANFLEDQGLPTEVRSMVKSMDEVLNSCFRNIEANEVYAETCFMDPRFKKHGFTDMSLYEATLAAMSRRIEENTPLAQSEASNTSSVMEKSSLWEHFDGEVQKLSEIPTTSAERKELDKYLGEPLLSRVENPLSWWKARRDCYPQLYDIMQSRLCIVATSVPGNRMFSKAGRVLADRRGRISSTKLPVIVFLNENME